jgi:hypothetical protein
VSRSSDDRERALRLARSDPRQLWLPNVAGPPSPELSHSIGTERPQEKTPPPVFSPLRRPISERERFALELDLSHLEWAADGGDGSVCSTDDGDVPTTLNLEPLLRGALLEAMAAVLLRADSACSSSTRQSEDSIGSAECTPRGMQGANPGQRSELALEGARRSPARRTPTARKKSKKAGRRRP